MDLDGKRALITGGGTGIGRAIALALAGEGCLVAIAGRREEKLRVTASLWKGKPRILARPADVADRASVRRLFAWAQRRLGPIDILVQAAGINIKRRKLAEIDPQDWDRILQVNATGAFNCLQGVLPQMRKRGEGLIINISSVAGKRASPLAGIAYGASKHAVTALGICAGLEEGKHGIRITNICPGEVDTPILDNRPEPLSREYRSRILKPEDIGMAVVMIARLPSRAHITELVIKPLHQSYA